MCDAFNSDKYGMSVLHYIAWSSKSGPEHLLPYVRKDDVIPFISRDSDGRSILHFAAQRGNLAILRFICDIPGGVAVTGKDIRGQTPLHYAVQSKRVDAIDILVNRGASIFDVDSMGRTVLHCAAKRNNVAAVTRLLELGANKNLFSLDKTGRTPLTLAYHHKASAVVQYLVSLGICGFDANCDDTTSSFEAHHGCTILRKEAWSVCGLYFPNLNLMHGLLLAFLAISSILCPISLFLRSDGIASVKEAKVW